MKVLIQEFFVNNYSLLPGYFCSHFVGGMAWQSLEYKYWTPNCRISPLCWKMNFPSLDGAAPISLGVWFPVNCICCLCGMLKFKTQNENKLNLVIFFLSFGLSLMQKSLWKSKECIVLVTCCFQYEELCSELSLRSIWVIFVVWTSYKNTLFDMIKISAVPFVLRQFPSVRTCASASLLSALNLYHSSFKFILTHRHFSCSLAMCWTLFSLWHLCSVN